MFTIIQQLFRLHLMLLLLMFSINVSGQSPVYKNYTVNDGLPSQVVYCALQDQQGYMWFGTDAGVSRFDGKHFENFTSRDGLSDNEVLKIYQGSDGRIWLLMLNGTLSYFKNGQIYSSFNTENLKNAQTKLELMSFLEDTEHNLWFGSSGKEMILITPKNNVQVLNLDTLERFTSNRLVYPIQNANEVMAIVGSCLYQIKDLRFSLIDTACYVAKNLPFVVTEKLDSQSVATSFKDGIREIKNGKSTLILGKEMIPDYEAIQRMYIDKNKGLWLLTSNLNTMYFERTTKGYKYKTSFLKGTYMGAVMMDNEGNKWFCTVGKGIFKLSNDADQIKLFEGNSVIDKTEIWSVNVDSNDNLWFGTGARNLYCIIKDSIKLEIDLGNEKYRMGRITRIVFDKLNNAWCSVSNGLVCVHRDSSNAFSIEEVTTISNLRNFNAKYVGFDRNNEIFFTSFRGVQKVFKRNGKYVFSNFIPTSLDLSGRVFCLYFDNDNFLWYEKFNVLNSYNGNLVKKYSNLASEFKSQISCIQGFSDSTLIIATYGNGVHFFKNGKIINHVTMADGLAGDLCRKVFVDSSVIYVATNQGFSYFSYVNNRISDINTFTTSDGIVSNDIKDICVKGEKIYLATSAGLCVVNKRISQLSSSRPPVYVQSITTRNSSITDFRQLKFLYNTDFNVNYIAITFEQPDKISYEYKITGSDKNWTETKNNSISFSSLSPGDYTFLLKAKKYNSEWSKPTVIQFSIIPPIWQQWWFRTFLVSLLIGFGYSLLKYFTERNYRLQLRILKEEQTLADERSRISADMHDDLGADLSNLLLMTRMKTNDANSETPDYGDLNNLEDFATGLIGKVDEIIWALNPKNDTLKGLIDFMYGYTKKVSHLSGILAEITFPDEIPDHHISAVFRRNLFLVLKETLNNIVRHSNANCISIIAQFKDNDLELIIEDNGNGFNLNNYQSEGDGLLNMHKRIQEIGGTFSLESKIGNGTVVNIKVPCF
ncbi:MAG: hypothetical protein IPO83_17020 [Chitinophagaceae bacterium]|nr:hypothetical protein [Chitinophagaceae bacterium]